MSAVPFRNASIGNPKTGEVLTPDQVNDRILILADAIEQSVPRLTEMIHELARVTALYEQTYDDALLASEARSKEQREADARQACRLATTPLGFPLAKRKLDLEADIKALREEQHNLRAVLSGWQTAARNVQTAMGAWTGAAS